MAKQDDVLKALLSIGGEKPKKQITMKRFGVDFEITAIDGKQLAQMREQATFTTKKGSVLDEQKLGSLIIEKGCIVPNWADKQLIDKYGDAESAIQNTLLAGEIARVSSEILDISGFNEDTEEIKN
jgi:hypothetical protein